MNRRKIVDAAELLNIINGPSNKQQSRGMDDINAELFSTRCAFANHCIFDTCALLHTNSPLL